MNDDDADDGGVAVNDDNEGEGQYYGWLYEELKRGKTST